MNKRSIFQIAMVCCISLFVFVGCQGGEDFENTSSSGDSNNKNYQEQNTKNSGFNVTVGDEFTKILKTGQIGTYESNDDGDLQKGLPRDFTKNGDIVIDNSTGLIWQDQNSHDFKFRKVSWYIAQEDCANLTLAGYNNWRLPTLKELMSITDKSKYKITDSDEPSIDSAFKVIADDNIQYWTSVTNQEDRSKAWFIDFKYGSYGNIVKDDTKRVRCVTNG